MKQQFKDIIIIYNPVSTGNSQANAEKLKSELVPRMKTTSIRLFATEYAGHAEKIGKEYAKHDNALLVSSSGDGGYNELVNGVLSAKEPKVTVCVLPSGNANDHYHATGENNLVETIVESKTTLIDVLKVEGTQQDKVWLRYAHSYIGVGITAYVGKKLTEAKLNPINEKWLTVKYLLKFGHVSLKVTSWGQQKFRRYSSLVIGNINRMSKVIKLDADTSLIDGKFEVYTIRTRSPLGLIKALIAASAVGAKLIERTEKIEFISKNDFEIQCDGEVFKVRGSKKCVVSAMRQSLRTVG